MAEALNEPGTRRARVTPPRAGLTGREVLRKLVHMAVGLFAFAVVFLGPALSALVAAAAVAMNLFLLPRVGGKVLWREAEAARGHSLGIVLYPAAVLALILVFWNQLEVAVGVWGILAFGDGMASLVGMGVGGPRLGWNPRKTWSGTLAYWVFGTVGAFALLGWTLHHQGRVTDLSYLLVASAVTAGVAAFVESQPLGIDDNLSVPPLAGLMLHGMMLAQVYWAVVDPAVWWRAIAIGIAVNLALAVPAYLARSVDRSGAIAGLAIGTLVWASLGWRGFVVLLAFFVIGTAATKLGYRRKAERQLAQESGGRRGAKHALANTSVPAMAALFAATTPYPKLYLIAFVAAFATATSDTLGSEIGQLWGRRTFLITTLRPVPRGTEGAVSVEGTVAGIVGSAGLAALGWAFGFYGLRGVAIVVAAAFVGTTLESLIGATLERRGWLDNEAVNFTNTLIGALAGVGLAVLFG